MSNLVSSGESVLNSSSYDDDNKHCITMTAADVVSRFKIESCADWVAKNRLNKVAVQFPQDLSKHVPQVIRQLKLMMPSIRFYCIFSSPAAKCCVSAKDAAYLSCDGLIQFGRSCLTPSKVKVLRVLAPYWPVDVNVVANAVVGVASGCEVQSVTKSSSSCEKNVHKHVVIIYDTRCAYAVGKVEDTLQEIGVTNFMVSKIVFPEHVQKHQFCSDYSGHDSNLEFVASECSCSKDYSAGACNYCSIIYSSVKCCSICREAVLANFNEIKYYAVNRRLFSVPRSIEDGNVVYVYVGRPGSSMTVFIQKLATSSFYSINPENGSTSLKDVLKMSAKTSFKIEQIRDAKTIGLLVSNYMFNHGRIIERFKSLIKSVGKYTFLQYAAHPDLPKLANIPGVDVWVYLACPESSVLDSAVIDPELCKLLVSPWQLEVALNNRREWNLECEIESEELLPGGHSYVAFPEEIGELSEKRPSVSLLRNNRLQVTGTEQQTPEEASKHLSKALQPYSQRQLLLAEGFSRGLVWGDTIWRGLQPHAEPTVALGTVVEGRRGVASGYSCEASQEC